MLLIKIVLIWKQKELHPELMLSAKPTRTYANVNLVFFNSLSIRKHSSTTTKNYTIAILAEFRKVAIRVYHDKITVWSTTTRCRDEHSDYTATTISHRLRTSTLFQHSVCLEQNF